ncbi:uncharacterized protein LOC114940799 [Nylanderia fulva]|uniref:uncharacterized protein LOC114940799 n=1 Tax=Nylanderia fulva TaxID=613905 RepID=UPI0010FADEF3|nr:uncharacterized protein LOC114940799 [Nylanderia fulva]
MFKLMVIFMLASLVTVQCGTIVASSPIIGKLISESVIESHGNSVVHPSKVPLALGASSPVLLKYGPDVALVQQEPVVVQPLVKASLVAEKTIEAHGHHVVHPVAAKPLATLDSHFAIPISTRGLAYAAPIYYPTYPHHQLIAEKTVSNYGHSVHHV